MAKTEIRSGQVKDQTINRDDIDITTAGKALVTKIIAGDNISISGTGVDSGTGDVTINANISSSSPVVSTVPFYIDGALTVIQNVTGKFVAPSVGKIKNVIITLDDSGTAGSTIVDVNKNGSTIFTTQANRPTINYSDTDKTVISVTPDIVDFVANDIFTFDIDSVATGADCLTIILVLDGAFEYQHTHSDFYTKADIDYFVKRKTYSGASLINANSQIISPIDSLGGILLIKWSDGNHYGNVCLSVSSTVSGRSITQLSGTTSTGIYVSNVTLFMGADFTSNLVITISGTGIANYSIEVLFFGSSITLLNEPFSSTPSDYKTSFTPVYDRNGIATLDILANGTIESTGFITTDHGLSVGTDALNPNVNEIKLGNGSSTYFNPTTKDLCISRNAYYYVTGGYWRRLLAENSASMIKISSDGGLHFFVNSDANNTVNSTINFVEKAVIDSSGKLTTGSPYAGNSYGRNVLVNPDFRVVQRTTFGTYYTGATGLNRVADRWKVYRTGLAGDLAYGCKTATDSVNNRIILAGRTPAATSVQDISIVQELETFDSVQFKGNKAVLAFRLYTDGNFSGTGVTVRLVYGTGTDESFQNGFTGQTNAIEQSILPTNSQYIEFVLITPDLIPTTATQLAVQFTYTPTGTAGNYDRFGISACNLFSGNQFHGWDFPNIQENISRCQRYYESNLYPGESLTGYQNLVNYAQVCNAIAANAVGDLEGTHVNFKVSKRTYPTITIYAPGSGAANAVRHMYGDCPTAYIQSAYRGRNGFGRISLQSSTHPAINKGEVGVFHWVADADF